MWILLQGKVVVIGAGPAGLSAAHQLKKLGAVVSWCCALVYIHSCAFRAINKTCCYSNGSNSLRHHHHTDHSAIFARWCHCTPQSNTCFLGPGPCESLPEWHVNLFCHFCTADSCAKHTQTKLHCDIYSNSPHPVLLAVLVMQADNAEIAINWHAVVIIHIMLLLSWMLCTSLNLVVTTFLCAVNEQLVELILTCYKWCSKWT